jgi:hypothetical protein
MSQPKPQVLQTYTLLQIAAEALLGRAPNDPAARAGEGLEGHPLAAPVKLNKRTPA